MAQYLKDALSQIWQSKCTHLCQAKSACFPDQIKLNCVWNLSIS